MEWQHPIEMLQLGCTDQLKINLAFQAFIKLCEVDKLRDIEYYYDKDLDMIYLSSTDKKEQVLHVPISIWQPLSPAVLHSISTTLLKAHPKATINMLLRTPDTSLLHYKLTEGLRKPPTPEASKEKRALQDQQQCIHNELNKRKLELYEEAKRKKLETSEAGDRLKCEKMN